MTMHLRNVKSAPKRSDQEFLPAALEILETPPSPLQSTFLLVICGFVVAGLAWSYFSRIDIIAVAQGKIQPTGRVKLVQPVETGKVVGLEVANGRHVAAGEVVLQLDTGDARAEEIGATEEFEAARAEVLRRRIAVDLGRRNVTVPPLLEASLEHGAATMTEREAGVLAGDLAQLAANVGSLRAQIYQKEAERDRLKATSVAQRDLIAILDERVQMKTTLIQKNAGSRADLIDAAETLLEQKTTLATELGQQSESEANIGVLRQEIARAFGAFIADNGQKLAEAQRRADDAEQKLAKAHVRMSHMMLRSPIDGTVEALSVTTVGQVVTVGEELMRIVPDGSELEIQCYLPNKDAGFVQAGQQAVVKLEAFPFTRYGTLGGRVTQVADDAIPEPDAQQIEGNPARSNKGGMFAGAERTQNLVFPVTLKPDAVKIKVDGKDVPLSPGMAVNVEIRTGSRRILEYVFSPIAEVASRAMTER